MSTLPFSDTASASPDTTRPPADVSCLVSIALLSDARRAGDTRRCAEDPLPWCCPFRECWREGERFFDLDEFLLDFPPVGAAEPLPPAFLERSEEEPAAFLPLPAEPLDVFPWFPPVGEVGEPPAVVEGWALV